MTLTKDSLTLLPQQTLHLVEQIDAIDRFDQVKVKASREAEGEIAWGAVARDRYQEHGGQLRPHAAQTTGDFQTVKARQADVDQRDVERPGACQVQAL